MKPVHFKGVNYEPLLLAELVTQGTRQTVVTSDVITLAACRSCAVRIAVVVDAKYHLLTGCLVPEQHFQSLVVVAAHLLKKAVAPQLQYAQRQNASRQVFAEGRDFSPHLSSQPNMRNSPRFR